MAVDLYAESIKLHVKIMSHFVIVMIVELRWFRMDRLLSTFF